MVRDRYVVDVRPATQGRPSSGGDDGGVAAYVILIVIFAVLIGTCS